MYIAKAARFRCAAATASAAKTGNVFKAVSMRRGTKDRRDAAEGKATKPQALAERGSLAHDSCGGTHTAVDHKEKQ